MTEKLNACPWCGDIPTIFDASSVLEYDALPFQPRCHDKYDCPVEFSWYATKQEAIKAWNARYQPRCGDCRHFLEHKPTWCWKLDLGVNEDFYCANFVRK